MAVRAVHFCWDADPSLREFCVILSDTFRHFPTKAPINDVTGVPNMLLKQRVTMRAISHPAFAMRRSGVRSSSAPPILFMVPGLTF